MNIQTSGNFKVWAKDMKEYIFWHDTHSKSLIEYFETTWTMDTKLTFQQMKQCCVDQGVDIEVDSALHMVIGALLDGESKMLAEIVEFNNPDNMETHRSGLELWRLLKYNLVAPPHAADLFRGLVAGPRLSLGPKQKESL